MMCVLELWTYGWYCVVQCIVIVVQYSSGGVVQCGGGGVVQCGGGGVVQCVPLVG